MSAQRNWLAKEKAEEHPLVIQELGLPLTSGPWYNASLELTHAGHIASCKLTFHGRQSSSDVLIRAVRRGGARSTLLYNTIGKAQWEVLQLDASVAAGGGLARRVSLLDQQVQAQPQLRAGAQGVHRTPAGGPARHSGLPGQQQSGMQLNNDVHKVHAGSEGAKARHHSPPDLQAGQQLRTGEAGEAANVQAGHGSVPDLHEGLQPRVGEGRAHEATAGLQAEAQPGSSLPGCDAVLPPRTAGNGAGFNSVAKGR